MKINIIIDCETIKELKDHLQMLKLQVAQKQDKLKLTNEAELPPMTFSHDNCYGSHTAVVLKEGETIDIVSATT